MTTSLERLASLAAALVDAPMAAIVRVSPERVDIVAGHHVPAVAYAVDIDEVAAGFEPMQPGIVCNMQENIYFSTHPLVVGAPFLKALIRFPLPVSGRVSLVIGYSEPIAMLPADRLQALAELAQLAAREYEIDQHHGQGLPPQAVTLEHVIMQAEQSSQPVAILDSNLGYLHVNGAMATLNKLSAKSHVGRRIHDINVPSVEALEAIFQIALRDGRSFEQVELVGQRDGDNVRIYSVSCRPVLIVGREMPVLEVISSDVTSLRADETRLENGLAEGPYAKAFGLDPTARFLTETLVKRQSLRQRKSTSYLTLRSWRKPVRSYQIEALKALKTAPPHALVDTAATEIVEAVSRIVGTSSFAHVTPIPCSRSSDDACFSRMIAEEVSRRIGKPLTMLLASAPQKGSSHPKENASRPPLRLVGEASGPCLVVDDVATSGAHLEEAILKLRPSAMSVFAVAWIGGDVDDKAEDA
jgi:predicted amidophosphoribosyltransferase/PAS domain-containing protein